MNKRSLLYALGLLALMMGAYVGARALMAKQLTAMYGQPLISRMTARASNASGPAAGDSTVAHKVIAYYFHGNVRCVSCRKIEAYATEAVDSGFVEPLANGRLEWHVINVDSAQNKHFIQDYQLYTKSVIVADFVNGRQIRWKNLEKVWLLLGNKAEFISYIRQEVQSYLDGK